VKCPRIWARAGARRLRAAMRGYVHLKTQGELGRVEDVLHALASTDLGIGGKARASFFGSGMPMAEKVVRQYLLVQIGGADLKAKLLTVMSSPGKALVHPLPRAWSRTLARDGVEVAPFRSSIWWALYLIGMCGYAAIAMVKTLALSVIRSSTPDLAGSAYFDGISAAQLPRNERPSYDIFTWYASRPDRPPEVTKLTHSIGSAGERRAQDLPLVHVSQVQPLPGTWTARLKLCGLYAKLIVQAFVDLLRGRWWHALLLREAERAALIKAAAPGDLPFEYLVSNSGWLYRPLWTYAAEEVGCRISFYFYSTNAAVFKAPEGYPRQNNHWELCTWPRYLVWEGGQESFLRRLGLAGEVERVGPIWFSDADAKLPEVSHPAVAVFDVQPMRDSIYMPLALGFEYYTAATAIGFAEDICEAARALNVSVLWKRKRHIGSNAHRRYARVMDSFTQSGVIIPVEPGLAAQHIIREADCVISMPFTSTALLARSMNKPSCYYDPTGRVLPDDRSAYGIDVLTSPAALKDWIASTGVL
jgi:polysaccharide biosynthesis PFTS motif protein